MSKKERTLVVIKPDGVQRSLIGEIIKRFEQMGLKLVGIKMFIPSEDFIEKHYLSDPGWLEAVGKKSLDSGKGGAESAKEAGRVILEGMKKLMSSGPVVAMVWEGMNSVVIVRKVVGGTEPASSDAGTIRGDYTIDSYKVANADGRAVRNIVHASGSVEEAEAEIKHWFKSSELSDYRLIQEEILYDVNLDGILE